MNDITQNGPVSAQSGHNYGIDLLRIVCMLMVVVLHVLGPGGVLEFFDAMPSGAMPGRRATAYFLESAAYCAVNCYALISGYVSLNAKHKYSNLAALWLQVAFYTVTVTEAFAIFAPGGVTREDWLNAFFPVTRKDYWYFSAYFGMYLFVPLLNAAFDQIGKRRLQVMLVTFVLAFSVFPMLFGSDPFVTAGGYSVLWLMILYVAGRYIARYGLLSRVRTGWLTAGYFLMALLTLASVTPDPKGMDLLGGKVTMLSYLSPTVVGESVLLLLSFSRMKTSPAMNKVIRFLAPLSFSVYVIHTGPLLWNRFFVKHFTSYAVLSPAGLVGAVLGTVAVVYVVCTLIDYVRAKLFSAVRVKERLEKLEQRTMKDLF